MALQLRRSDTKEVLRVGRSPFRLGLRASYSEFVTRRQVADRLQQQLREAEQMIQSQQKIIVEQSPQSSHATPMAVQTSASIVQVSSGDRVRYCSPVGLYPNFSCITASVV